MCVETMYTWWCWGVDEWYSHLLFGFMTFWVSVTDVTLSTKLYDKRDDFDFRIVTSLIHVFAAIYPSLQLWCLHLATCKIRHSLLFVWWFYRQSGLLTKKLVDQGYTLEKLKTYFKKFYGRYNDLVQFYNLLMCVTYLRFHATGYILLIPRQVRGHSRWHL